MLELDLILQQFLDEGWCSLGEADRALFVEILTTNDPELHAWLSGMGDPPERFAKLVETVRLAVRKQKGAS